jgi:hypothetical protein
MHIADPETPKYDMSIHSNPDAMAWAKFHQETHPECDLDEMLGWFANAMMAMHDHDAAKHKVEIDGWELVWVKSGELIRKLIEEVKAAKVEVASLIETRKRENADLRVLLIAERERCVKTAEARRWCGLGKGLEAAWYDTGIDSAVAAIRALARPADDKTKEGYEKDSQVCGVCERP